MSYTTADLLSAISRRSFAPTGQVTFTPAELLAVADEVLANEILPDIISVREEFFVASKDVTITQGVNAVDIPARATGLTVREIWLVDSNGAVTPDFPRREPEEITTVGTGEPAGFYLKFNQIILTPTPATTSGKSLRVFYPLAPAAHVLTTAAGQISAIDTVTNVVTVASIPSAWATGNVFDLIRQDGGQEPLVTDQTSVLVSGTTISFTSLPTGLRIGDYVALAGQTPLVQLPDVYRAALAQGVAAQILSDMNQPGADKSMKLFEKMLANAKKLITPRLQGEDRKVTPSNWF